MDSTTTTPLPTATTVGPLISVGVILVSCASTVGCALIICVCVKRFCCQARENQTLRSERARRPLTALTAEGAEDYHLQVCCEPVENSNAGANVADPPPPYSKADPNIERLPTSQELKEQSLEDPPPYSNE